MKQTTRGSSIAFALVAALAVTAVTGAQQTASDYGGIDPAVVAAWERAGAQFAWRDNTPAFEFRRGEAPSAEEIRALPQPSVPFRLGLSDPLLSVSQLAALGALKQLRRLTCSSCEAPDGGGLLWLSTLKQVESITITRTLRQITPEDLRGLTELPRLINLGLDSDLDLTDAHLRELVKLRQLQSLSINGSDLSDAGIERLAELPALRGLSIDQSKITGASLGRLAGMPHLRSLGLGDNPFSDQAPAEIAKLTQLERLVLWSGKVDGAWLKQVAKLPNLRHLGLSFSGVTDDGVKELARMVQLEALNLHGTKVTNAGLKGLMRLEHLRVLKVGRTGVTDAGLRQLTAFPQLETLSLDDVTDATLREVVALRSLTELEVVNDGSFTDEGLKGLQTLPRLGRLALPGGLVLPRRTGRITAGGIRTLATARPSLRISAGDKSVRAILDMLAVDASLAEAAPEARLASLERVRGHVSAGELRRVDDQILSVLIRNWPVRTERIGSALDRVIAAIPGGSSPAARLIATLAAVEPLAADGALASRAERLLSAALVGVTDKPLRSRGLAVLTKAHLAQGHLVQARAALEESLTLLPSRTSRSAAPLLADLAGIEARQGDDALALDHYISAALLVPLSAAQDADLRRIYRTVHGSAAGLEEDLSRRHRALFPNPVAPARYVPSASRSQRVVLLELFTGSACPPCVAPDLAFDALLGRYPADTVVAVAYHANVPSPDPMVVTGGIRRGDYYDRGVPSMYIDGGPDQGGGGNRAAAPDTYRRYTSAIDTRLEAATSTGLSVAASASGDHVTVRAIVAGLPATRDGLRLHLLLVERELGFANENGIRQHPMVVRAVAGANAAGLPLIGEGTTTHTFSLSAIRADVATTLATEIARRRKTNPLAGFTAEGHAVTAIDPARLVVVAFVQQGAAAGAEPNVLQAAQAEVVFGAPGTNEGAVVAAKKPRK